MNLIDILFNAGSGGLFGLIGSGVTTYLRLHEKKIDNAHALALAEKQYLSAEQVAGWQAFAASHQSAASDGEQKVSTWAANIRTLTRPALTLILSIAAVVSVVWIDDATAKANALQNVQMLAGTAVSWWFGSRMAGQLTARK